MSGGGAAGLIPCRPLLSAVETTTVGDVRLGNPVNGTDRLVSGAAGSWTQPGRVMVRLLESFAVIAGGRPIELPPAAQRLLAFLALRDGICPRLEAATALWPNAPERHAHAALRSTLWRLRRLAPEVIDPSATELALAPDAYVDIGEMRDLARRLLRAHDPVDSKELAVERLAGTLLPGWYDEWVLVEREQLHQLQLHGLEAIAARFLDGGRHGAAADAALAAIRLDPLRESPYRLLVRVHLDEGNASEAMRTYADYARLLRDELDIAPSGQFDALLRPVVAARGRRAVNGTPL